MSLIGIIITLLAIGTILSGLQALRKSNKKFDLTPEQLADIKKRNKRLDEEEKKDE